MYQITDTLFILVDIIISKIMLQFYIFDIIDIKKVNLSLYRWCMHDNRRRGRYTKNQQKGYQPSKPNPSDVNFK